MELNHSVAMLMSLRLMTRVLMVVRPVLTGVLMVMNFAPLAVGVLMKMLMRVLVGVGMIVLVQMLLLIVRMFVRVLMRMFMPMQVLMFVFSFHFILLLRPSVQFVDFIRP